MSGEDAMYELSVNLPTSPKGDPVQIPGLGTFNNGGTYTITKDEAEAFRTYHTKQVPVFNEETNAIVGADTELGDTLLQAAKSMYGVEVTTSETESKEPKKTQVPPQQATPADTKKGGEH